MSYRVDAVGALIFKPKDEDKPTIESLNKEVVELRTEVELLKNELKEIKKIVNKLSSF
ncbi:hypothetical protein KQI68_06550 [Peptoniphilus sp. MSJ-1]|uniref:Uncharacterized protein n=1 Tax=Peptoniphilus ovalis TaxID=2841503 RepID=A0ABS6FJ21_9FIRM|nr:hypothetical protein [Peptoniphilus ovalis]MBU5669497.1 hypothetical protein [Peptoniphilus ovalis]